MLGMRPMISVRATGTVRPTMPMRAILAMRPIDALRAIPEMRPIRDLRAKSLLRPTTPVRAKENMRPKESVRANDVMRPTPLVRANESMRPIRRVRAMKFVRPTIQLRAKVGVRPRESLRANTGSVSANEHTRDCGLTGYGQGSGSMDRANRAITRFETQSRQAFTGLRLRGINRPGFDTGRPCVPPIFREIGGLTRPGMAVSWQASWNTETFSIAIEHEPGSRGVPSSQGLAGLSLCLYEHLASRACFHFKSTTSDNSSRGLNVGSLRAYHGGTWVRANRRGIVRSAFGETELTSLRVPGGCPSETARRSRASKCVVDRNKIKLGGQAVRSGEPQVKFGFEPDPVSAGSVRANRTVSATAERHGRSKRWTGFDNYPGRKAEQSIAAPSGACVV